MTSLIDNTTEPAPRAVRRRVGAAIAMLAIAVTAAAAAKHLATGGVASAKIDDGMTQLRMNCGGDEDALLRARAEFLDAASVSVLDSYPAFLVHVATRAAQTPGEAPFDAVAGCDIQELRQHAATLGGAGTTPRTYWERLASELEAAR